MKKIIYSALVALSLGFMSTAQTASPITKMPCDANGYLILNKGFYENVSSWHLVVKEKIWNETKNCNNAL